MTLDTAFLGLIALATVIMAAVQVTAAIYAARAARDATEAARDLRRELGPILANARKAADDAARITALALTQVERVDEFVSATTEQVTASLSVLRNVVVGPVRQGTALWAGLRAALTFFADQGDRRRPDHEDEDENLFIG